MASAIWAPFTTWFSPSEVSTLVGPTPACTHSLAGSSGTRFELRDERCFYDMVFEAHKSLFFFSGSFRFFFNPSESLWYLRAQRCRRSCQFENRMIHAWLFVVQGKIVANADRTGATDMIQLRVLCSMIDSATESLCLTSNCPVDCRWTRVNLGELDEVLLRWERQSMFWAESLCKDFLGREVDVWSVLQQLNQRRAVVVSWHLLEQNKILEFVMKKESCINLQAL